MDINGVNVTKCQCKKGLVETECEYCLYDFGEYYDKQAGEFKFPSCRHCGEGGYECPEILKRGYHCIYCSSEMGLVYICRNCSYEDCPKRDN